MGEKLSVVKDFNSMEKPKCRLCSADTSSQEIKGEFVYGGREDQHFWKCSQCGVIYLYPAMTEKEEKKFYAQEFEKFMDNRSGADTDWSGPEKHYQMNQREVMRRLPYLEPYLKDEGNCLEVGCSSGFMLAAVKNKGLKVYGIDPSGGFVDFVKSKGIDVFNNKEAFQERFKGKLDLIIHYYVLEHIRNPLDFISDYMDLLTDDGVMIFEAPCASDPLIELYKVPAFDEFYWSVAHHWYFDKKSMTYLLDKTGYAFKLYPEQRYDISNHMTWMQDGKPGGLGRYDAIFEDELNELYKNQLKKHWYCDTLLGILKRNHRK